MGKNQIKLVQKPVIEHALVEIGTSVTSRLEELNVTNLVATSDTVQSLKTLRSGLNKELAEYENQRKEIKSAVNSPYQEFEATYKVEVSEKYESAINTLKTKIGEFEVSIKEDKLEKIKTYFTELCLDAGTQFVKFDDVGISINLTTSLKKYKEQCVAFIERVSDDVKLIQSAEYEAEMMIEYKKTLNASKAITEVRARKDAEKLEKERIKQKETDRRVRMLLNLAMVSSQMTQTYNYVSNDTIHIEIKDVENLSKDEFQTRYVAIERAIQLDKESKAPKIETTSSAPEIKAPVAPLKAPTVVPEAPVAEKTFTAKFQCTGTMKQLKGLAAYLKENNITYKTI